MTETSVVTRTFLETVPADLQQFRIGAYRPTHRKFDLQTVDRLEFVLEGGPINLLHHVGPYAYLVGGIDAEDVVVVGGMMDPAHDNAIGDDGLTSLGLTI